MTEPNGLQHPWGRAGARQIEEAAADFRRAILDEDSVLAPGTAVWTHLNAQAAHQAFNEQPDMGGDSFDTKLSRQFAGAPEGAVRLFAELYTLMLLPLHNYKGETKRIRIREVLELASLPFAPPDHVDRALDFRVYNGGQAFTTGKFRQLWFLVDFALWVTALDEAERAHLLASPQAFREALDAGVTTNAPSQRSALLYMLFPEYYLPIVNETHKQRVAASFGSLVGARTGELDRDLRTIYDRLLDEADGQPVDLYAEPYKSRWAGGVTSPRVHDPADPKRRAWLIRGSSVQGKDLVPVWRGEGWVSLPATNLREVDPQIGRDDLKVIVDEDYSHATYNVRAEKLDEFAAFLGRVQLGDVVATIDKGMLHVGTVTSDARYRQSPDGLANLVRDAEWQPGEGTDFADLPAELAARLKVQRDLLDLTQQLDYLVALEDSTQTVPPTTDDELILPSPTDELAESLNVGIEWLEECIALLSDRPQMIFYGPPGTGKTYIAQALAKHIAGDRVRLVQFHPSYSYEDFFEGYRPTAQGGFELSPGPMRKLVDQARQHTGDAFVLIIDEINRGNLAKVFGELYFLLEYRDETIELLYGDDDFSLPKNVFIIGTMNTADRSIALVDAAMRRRFSFLPLHPSEEPTRDVLRRWLGANGHDLHVADLLDELNSRIADPDFKIGPSYLMRSAVHEGEGLDRTWRTAILPLLEEHHYGEKSASEVAREFGLAAVEAAVRRRARPTSTVDEMGAVDERGTADETGIQDAAPADAD